MAIEVCGRRLVLSIKLLKYLLKEGKRGETFWQKGRIKFRGISNKSWEKHLSSILYSQGFSLVISARREWYIWGGVNDLRWEVAGIYIHEGNDAVYRFLLARLVLWYLNYIKMYANSLEFNIFSTIYIVVAQQSVIQSEIRRIHS